MEIIIMDDPYKKEEFSDRDTKKIIEKYFDYMSGKVLCRLCHKKINKNDKKVRDYTITFEKYSHIGLWIHEKCVVKKMS